MSKLLSAPFLRALAGAVLTVAAVADVVAAAELKVAIRNPSGVFVQSGEKGLEGFDVDLLERFAAWHHTRTGEELVLQYQEVENIAQLLDAAEAGGCDIAVGSITITAERAQRVDFSASYLAIRMVLFGKKGKIPAGPYQTALIGTTVGALAGSTGVARVAELQEEVDRLSTRVYPDYESLFGALLGESPQIDGVVTDVTHYWVLSKEEPLQLVAPMSDEQGLGFVLPKGSAWRERIDSFLDEFTHAPGYFQLVRRYFGKEASDMILFSRETKGR